MLRYDDYSCACIFERLLSYAFNQINNFIMVLFETVSQKTKIRDSESSRPKIRETETRRNTRKRDFETRSKRLQDSEIGTKISETLNFPGTIRHPSRGKGSPKWLPPLSLCVHFGKDFALKSGLYPLICREYIE